MEYLLKIIFGLLFYPIIMLILPKVFKRINRYYENNQMVDLGLLEDFKNNSEYYENRAYGAFGKMLTFCYLGGFIGFMLIGIWAAVKILKIILPNHVDTLLFD